MCLNPEFRCQLRAHCRTIYRIAPSLRGAADRLRVPLQRNVSGLCQFLPLSREARGSDSVSGGKKTIPHRSCLQLVQLRHDGITIMYKDRMLLFLPPFLNHRISRTPPATPVLPENKGFPAGPMPPFEVLHRPADPGGFRRGASNQPEKSLSPAANHCHTS